MNTLTKERYADELEGAFQKILAKNKSDLTDKKLRYTVALKTLSNSMEAFEPSSRFNELLLLQNHAIIQSFKKAFNSLLTEKKDTTLEELNETEFNLIYQDFLDDLRNSMPSKDPAITIIRLANIPLVLIKNADAIFAGTILFLENKEY